MGTLSWVKKIIALEQPIYTTTWEGLWRNFHTGAGQVNDAWDPDWLGSHSPLWAASTHAPVLNSDDGHKARTGQQGELPAPASVLSCAGEARGEAGRLNEEGVKRRRSPHASPGRPPRRGLPAAAHPAAAGGGSGAAPAQGQRCSKRGGAGREGRRQRAAGRGAWGGPAAADCGSFSSSSSAWAALRRFPPSPSPSSPPSPSSFPGGGIAAAVATALENEQVGGGGRAPALPAGLQRVEGGDEDLRRGRGGSRSVREGREGKGPWPGRAFGCRRRRRQQQRQPPLGRVSCGACIVLPGPSGAAKPERRRSIFSPGERGAAPLLLAAPPKEAAGAPG